MKATDKINDEILIELLTTVGLEYQGDFNSYYCCDSEQGGIRILLKGNKLKDLLYWIKEYYYEMGYGYGKKEGNREKLREIKKVLEVS